MMETVVSFLEKLGSATRMNREQLARAFEAADLVSEQKSALLAHDDGSLVRILKGREEMRSIIFIEDDALAPSPRNGKDNPRPR